MALLADKIQGMRIVSTTLGARGVGVEAFVAHVIILVAAGATLPPVTHFAASSTVSLMPSSCASSSVTGLSRMVATGCREKVMSRKGDLLSKACPSALPKKCFFGA